MANRIAGKGRQPKYVRFGVLTPQDFDQVAVVINQTNATVQALLPLPFACKIPLVAIVASGASGVTAFNIAVGTVAEAGALVADNSDVKTPPTTVQSAGSCLFENAGLTAPADKAVTLVAGVGQTFATSEPDAIFGQGTVLSLRYVSGGAVAGFIKVVIAVVPVDVKVPNPLVTGFSWATDVG